MRTSLMRILAGHTVPALVFAMVLTTSCGDEKKLDEDDHGGDHLPDDEVYAVVALPSGSEGIGLTRRELRSPVLRRFVRVSPRYQVCLDPVAFDDAAFAAFQDRVQVHGGATASFGLEAVVNRALATVDHFAASNKPQAGRVEIELLRPGSGTCSFNIVGAETGAFPFNDPDFSGQSRAYFNDYQLRATAGHMNSIPVAFIDVGLAAADRAVAAEYLIAAFIGLGESSLSGSYLSPATTATSPVKGYYLEEAAGQPRFDDDAQILYGFALIYQNVVKTSDLDAYYHYQDRFNPGDQEQDPELVLPANPALVTFESVLGDPYVQGARAIGDSLSVCVQNQSTATVAAESLTSFFDFVSPDVANGVIGLLSAREPTIKTRVQLVDDGCALVVSLRNESQYPFADRHINGLYAPEATLKDKAGGVTTLPVIYINVDNLDLDPAATLATAKPVKLVLQHEFAHFLGFRHSPSAKSIMSPAGYNESWDVEGGDGKMLDAFVRVWRP